MLKTAAISLLLGNALAGPAKLGKRQCPNIQVFGARETTAPAGYGSSITVVDDVLSAYSGSTAEAIDYPACGGQSTCGGISYADSVVDGISAVIEAVNSFNSECPDSQIVLVGYSQGGQIFDDALCGGGDPDEGYDDTAVPLSAAAVDMIVAAIFMGDPRFIAGVSYDVGTCEAGGFDARSASFDCPSASKIQSYCDAPDPYCCNGDDAAVHEGYGAEYGAAALSFIESKIGSGSGGGGGTGSGTVAEYGQCGGIGYTGATTCESPYVCVVSNAYYSQCLPS